jgi:hypothetical protein
VQKLKTLFQTNVVNVGNVNKAELIRASGNKSNVRETSETSGPDFEIRRFRHVPDICETTPKPDDACISDVSDVSDTSFHQEEEIFKGGEL